MKKLTLAILFGIIYFNTFGQHQIQYYKDYPKEFSIKTLYKIPFEEFNERTINFGKDSSRHWMKVRISNPENSEVLYYFEINSPWLDSVNFISQTGVRSGSFSWKTPLKERFYEHQNFVLPVKIKAKQDTTFYCNFYKKTMLINGDVSIKKAPEFVADKAFDYSFFGVFGGIALTVCLFSFFLFWVNKDPIYLYYSLYAILHLCFNLSVQGYFLKYYQPGLGVLITANELSSWILWLSQMSLMFFIKAFLWENTPLPNWLKKIWRITIALMLSIVFLKILWIYFLEKYHNVPNWLLLTITVAFLSSILTGFIMAMVALIKRINPSSTNAYLIGIIPFFVVSVFSYFRNLGLVQNHWLLGQHMQVVCITFDILVLMVGMGFRYKQIKTEKDKQTQLAIANKIKLLQEKERISRDLHDSVGSQLTIISTSLDNATYQAEKNTLKPEKLSQISENVREAVQSLRDSIWATHQNEINLESFETRLKTYISRMVDDHIKFNIDLKDKNLVLNALTALNLFRIIQEAIQNSLKHAEANEIEVLGKLEAKNYEIMITDNGKGFEGTNILKKECFGIENMKKRAEEINGKMDFDTSNGTCIKITFGI